MSIRERTCPRRAVGMAPTRLRYADYRCLPRNKMSSYPPESSEADSLSTCRGANHADAMVEVIGPGGVQMLAGADRLVIDQLPGALAAGRFGGLGKAREVART